MLSDDIIENKLIFFTGAPGSKWSAVSNLISHCPTVPFNTSDRSNNRNYNSDVSSHQGSYFGPGMEFGKNFHQLDKLSKNEIINEIIKPFSNSLNGYIIIKSHVFANHLDFIKHTFPFSKIVVVYRSLQESINHWKRAGGFNITYPNYLSYYKDDELFESRIHQEIKNAKKWIKDNDLSIQIANHNHFLDYWDVDYSKETYSSIKSLEESLDTCISYYNFDDIFFITR